MRPPSPDRDRLLDRARDRAWRRLARRRRRDQRQPDAAGHRFDARDRTCSPRSCRRRRTAPSRSSSSPTRAASTRSQNTKVVNATTKSLSNADGVEKAVSPLSDKGSDQLSKDGTTGYVSLTLSIGQGELEEDAGEGDPRRRAAGGRRRLGRLRGRLPRPGALEAVDPLERGDRDRRRRDHPAVRVRDRRRDVAADRHRDRLGRLRPVADLHPQPPDDGLDRRPDPRDDDRPRRRDRLLAVHRHPLSRAARGRGRAAARPSPGRPRARAARSRSPAARW